MIDAVNLSKLYGRGVYALRDLTMRVDKGEFVFLTGPSGAGKSTLLRLLLRRDVPTDGQLVVNGRDLASLKTREVQAYRRSLGFVFQDFKLLPAKTVLENVAFVPHVLGMAGTQQQRRTFQVLKWVGLQHRMNAFPMELSGGEQQRIAIARALVNDPTTHPGRRAHRQPRPGPLARDHEPVSGDQRARYDRRGRDPRSGVDPARRPPVADAGSRTHR